VLELSTKLAEIAGIHGRVTAAALETCLDECAKATKKLADVLDVNLSLDAHRDGLRGGCNPPSAQLRH